MLPASRTISGWWSPAPARSVDSQHVIESVCTTTSDAQAVLAAVHDVATVCDAVGYRAKRCLRRCLGVATPRHQSTESTHRHRIRRKGTGSDAQAQRNTAQARAIRVDASSGRVGDARIHRAARTSAPRERGVCVLSSVRVTKAQRDQYISHTGSDARDTFQGDIGGGWRGSSDATLACSRTLVLHGGTEPTPRAR